MVIWHMYSHSFRLESSYIDMQASSVGNISLYITLRQVHTAAIPQICWYHLHIHSITIPWPPNMLIGPPNSFIWLGNAFGWHTNSFTTRAYMFIRHHKIPLHIESHHVTMTAEPFIRPPNMLQWPATTFIGSPNMSPHIHNGIQTYSDWH